MKCTHVRIPSAPSLEHGGTDTGFEFHLASSPRLSKLLWIRFTCLVCSLLFGLTVIMGSRAEPHFKWWQTTWILLIMCFPALGQRCHIAGSLPCEDACQLVEAVKGRLWGRRYCAEESRRTASNLAIRVKSLFPEPLTARKECIWIENKCVNNGTFKESLSQTSGELLICHMLLVNTQVCRNVLWF